MTQTKKSFARSAAELVVIVGVALGLALAVQAFIVKPYEIPSGSMLPTLHINQRVLVDRLGSHFIVAQDRRHHRLSPAGQRELRGPERGRERGRAQSQRACDVAQTKESTQTYIKRVVGLPGDRLSIRDGHVYRNGVREKDSFTEPCDGASECNFPATITVPRGDYYMMGDNRPDSLDSRFWGPVPKAWIIGKAFFTYWPPDRIGFL